MWLLGFLQDLYLHVLKRLVVLRMITDLMNDRSADHALYRSKVQELPGGAGLPTDRRAGHAPDDLPQEHRTRSSFQKGAGPPAGGNTNRSMSKLRKRSIVPIRLLASAECENLPPGARAADRKQSTD